MTIAQPQVHSPGAKGVRHQTGIEISAVVGDLLADPARREYLLRFIAHLDLGGHQAGIVAGEDIHFPDQALVGNLKAGLFDPRSSTESS